MLILPPHLQIPALLAVIVATLALILSNRLRPDVVALMVLVVLNTLGLVSSTEALTGFSNPAILTIVGLFVISRALEVTGVIDWAAAQVLHIGGGQEGRLVAIFMGAGAILSLIMNNVAAAAVLLPAAVQVGAQSGVRASKLLMPMAFGILVGGMATLFTTPNIVLSGLLNEQGLGNLGFLDFFAVGAPVAIASLLYFVLIGRKYLPDRASAAQLNTRQLSHTLYEEYELEERLWEFRVLPSSRLVDVMLKESKIGSELGVTVMAIWRGSEAILTPASTECIHAGDFLLVLGREDRVTQLHSWGLVLGRHPHFDYTRAENNVDLTEVIIPPRSDSIGKTLTDLRFRQKFGLTSVALWRNGRSYRTDVGRMPLQLGDALLMVGAGNQIESLRREDDYLVLRSGHPMQIRQTRRAKWALLITAFVLAASIFEFMPTPEAMLAGAVGMVLAGCLTMDEAYRAVEWRVIFLIAGMLPLSIAMSNTGLAGQLGDILVNTLAPFGSLALIGGMFILTMLVTQVMSAQVSAILLGPVAIAAAQSVGVNPQAMAVAVAIACSTAFLTPIAHPVNVLVMGPGGYVPSDFPRVGLALTGIAIVITLIGVAVVYGVR